MRAALAALWRVGVTAGEGPASVDLLDPSRAGAEDAFVTVNDGVMGGVSTSCVDVGGGALVFSGSVRLEHGGGFASMRADIGALDLRPFAGIELVVRADGRRYQLTLRDHTRPDGVLHRAGFETRAGEVLTLRLPFEHFEPRLRGRPVPDAPRLDRGRIRQLGVLIADRQAGDFRLALLAVRAYR